MKELHITVHEEESGKEREASPAHVSLSPFFFSRLPLTPGSFLEMILVGEELHPLGYSLSMSTRTERGRNAS